MRRPTMANGTVARTVRRTVRRQARRRMMAIRWSCVPREPRRRAHDKQASPTQRTIDQAARAAPSTNTPSKRRTGRRRRLGAATRFVRLCRFVRFVRPGRFAIAGLLAGQLAQSLLFLLSLLFQISLALFKRIIGFCQNGIPDQTMHDKSRRSAPARSTTTTSNERSQRAQQMTRQHSGCARRVPRRTAAAGCWPSVAARAARSSTTGSVRPTRPARTACSGIGTAIALFLRARLIDR